MCALIQVLLVGNYLYSHDAILIGVEPTMEQPSSQLQNITKMKTAASKQEVSKSASVLVVSDSSSISTSPQNVPPTIMSHTQRQQMIIDCRLEVEKYMKPFIEKNIEEKTPIFDWIWIMNDNNAGESDQPYSLIMFQIEHLQKETPNNKNSRVKYHRNGIWLCQDYELGKNYQAINVYKRHDKEDKLFLKCNTTNVNKILFYDDEMTVSGGKSSSSTTTRRGVGGSPTLSYDVSLQLKCSKLEQENPPFPTTTTTTPINTNRIQLGACLKFQTGDKDHPRYYTPREKVLEYIEYHRLLGVQHFWISINEEFNLTGLEINAPDITYLPFDFNWLGFYKKGYSNGYYGGGNFFQSTASNQCLYRSKQYKLDWILTTDTDEYIWLSPDLISRMNNPKYPLLEYLTTYHDTNENHNTLIMNSIPFGRNRQLQSNETKFDLVIDYTYRATTDTPWNVKHHRWKNIYNVKTAQKVSIHAVDYPADAVEKLNVSQIHLNHYKQPHGGVFQGFKDLKQETSLRDRYHDEMVTRLANLKLHD